MNGQAVYSTLWTLGFTQKAALAISDVLYERLLCLRIKPQHVHGAVIDTDATTITQGHIDLPHAHLTLPP